MEVVVSLLAACLGCFGFVLYLSFIRKSEIKISWIKRFWIIVNLLVWAYEFFFLIAVCGGVKGFAVYFGGGLGDLLYFFLLAGTVLLHIGLLAVLIYNRRRTVFFAVLVCLPVAPLYKMHTVAARGNERNGYMIGGSRVGLYFDPEALCERKELEEAANPMDSGAAAAFGLWLHEAKQGSVRAQYEVGICYTLGNGVEQNDSLAIKWFRKAAEGGHVQCQISMGAFYYNGSHGFDVDYREAFNWFLKAAEQGHDYAQYLVGRCYAQGEGVKQNDEKAFEWLRLAARQGNEEARELLRVNKQTW